MERCLSCFRVGRVVGWATLILLAVAVVSSAEVYQWRTAIDGSVADLSKWGLSNDPNGPIPTVPPGPSDTLAISAESFSQSSYSVAFPSSADYAALYVGRPFSVPERDTIVLSLANRFNPSDTPVSLNFLNVEFGGDDAVVLGALNAGGRFNITTFNTDVAYDVRLASFTDWTTGSLNFKAHGDGEHANLSLIESRLEVTDPGGVRLSSDSLQATQMHAIYLEDSSLRLTGPLVVEAAPAGVVAMPITTSESLIVTPRLEIATTPGGDGGTVIVQVGSGATGDPGARIVAGTGGIAIGHNDATSASTGVLQIKSSNFVTSDGDVVVNRTGRIEIPSYPQYGLIEIDADLHVVGGTVTGFEGVQMGDGGRIFASQGATLIANGTLGGDGPFDALLRSGATLTATGNGVDPLALRLALGQAGTAPATLTLTDAGTALVAGVLTLGAEQTTTLPGGRATLTVDTRATGHLRRIDAGLGIGSVGRLIVQDGVQGDGPTTVSVSEGIQLGVLGSTAEDDGFGEIRVFGREAVLNARNVAVHHGSIDLRAGGTLQLLRNPGQPDQPGTVDDPTLTLADAGAMASVRGGSLYVERIDTPDRSAAALGYDGLLGSKVAIDRDLRTGERASTALLTNARLGDDVQPEEFILGPGSALGLDVAAGDTVLLRGGQLGHTGPEGSVVHRSAKVSGALVVEAASRAYVNEITSTGKVTLGGGTLISEGSRLTLSGELAGYGTVDLIGQPQLRALAGSRITLTPGETLTLRDPTLDPFIQPASHAAISANFLNVALNGGTLVAERGQIEGRFTGGGTVRALRIIADEARFTADAELESTDTTFLIDSAVDAGTTTVRGDVQFAVSADVPATSVQIADGATLRVTETLMNLGFDQPVAGGGTFELAGSWRPSGLQTYTLSDHVTLTESASLTLTYEQVFDTQHNRLVAGDTFSLAGELVIRDASIGGGLSGFVPPDQALVLLEASEILGRFDRVSVTNLIGETPDDFALAVTYTDTQVLAQAALFGDADLSGGVEQGDLDAVLNHWGMSNVGGWAFGDLTQEGVVDQADLDAVLNHWGSAIAPDFRGVVVPEPTSTLVLTSAAGWLNLRRRGGYQPEPLRSCF